MSTWQLINRKNIIWLFGIGYILVSLSLVNQGSAPLFIESASAVGSIERRECFNTNTRSNNVCGTGCCKVFEGDVKGCRDTNKWEKYRVTKTTLATGWGATYTFTTFGTVYSLTDKVNDHESKNPKRSPIIRAGRCDGTARGQYKICCSKATGLPVNANRKNSDDLIPPYEAVCPRGSTHAGLNILTCPSLPPAPDPTPTVDIKADGSDGPITISSGSTATISWTSKNTSFCIIPALRGWTGTSGSASTNSLTSDSTYTAFCCPYGQVKLGDGSACTGGGSSNCALYGNPTLPRCSGASDSVKVNVSVPGPVGQSCGRCSNLPGNETTWVSWFDRDGGCDDDWWNQRVSIPNDPRCGGSGPPPPPPPPPPPASIGSFTATPLTIIRGLTPGGGTTLNWSTTNAVSCTINGGGVGTSGPQFESIGADASFTLICFNTANVATASRTVNINFIIPAPEIDEFIATPGVVFKGGQTTLSWIVWNIIPGDTGCSIDNGVGPVPVDSVTGKGSITATPPSGTVTYTLFCSNESGGEGGTASASLTVTVPFIEEVLP